MSSTSVLSRPQQPPVLPEDLVSMDTLIYLGFNEEVAHRLWQDRCKWLVRAHATLISDQLNESFLGAITDHLYEDGLESNTCDDNDRAWHKCMNDCGLNWPTKRAIMDSLFKKTRLTQSCLHWVRDTIELRFKALQEVLAADAASEDQAAQPTSEEDPVPRPSQPEETAMSEAVLRAAENPSDTTITLYKGIDRASVDHLFGDTGDLSRISALATAPPTDVCDFSSAYYFYVDRDVAENQACYIRRRSYLTRVVLVQATIQRSMLETGYEGPRRQEVYWPSEDWKRLVFHCRRKDEIPQDLARYMDARLVIATAAGRPTRHFVRGVNGPDDITEGMVLKNKHGEDAIQYCFRRYDADYFLAQHAELRMLPFTEMEYRAWCVETRDEPYKDIPPLVLPCRCVL
ncbi:hypothetical protein CCMA1212_007843 [Trichoderma ghanense]|uniref:Uncharacterized protein n=1 Tax=Trichoderma ghanense TaxID=65468 RepID=A0ABY2GWL7_9HYPO